MSGSREGVMLWMGFPRAHLLTCVSLTVSETMQNKDGVSVSFGCITNFLRKLGCLKHLCAHDLVGCLGSSDLGRLGWVVQGDLTRVCGPRGVGWGRGASPPQAPSVGVSAEGPWWQEVTCFPDLRHCIS